MPGLPAKPRWVYRAARKYWISGNGINPQAFFRRPERDHGGISVALTYEAAFQSLSGCAGVIRIDVPKLEALGYRIQQGYGDHAHICEVPYYDSESPTEAIRHAEAIIRCSEVVYG